MNSSAIKVSIIMLAYNIDKYVETAIKSIIQQKTTYPIQLVIAEDCSTDNTLEICTRYKKLYPDTITLIKHKKNAGLQRNFMDAHQHCEGEYIAICDGDDYWINKNKLQRMTDFMDANSDFAICFHRVINYYEENGSKSFSNGKQKQITNIVDLAKSNFITNSSSLFRRSYYPEVPEWFSQISLCDYAMHMLNAQHGKIYYFKQPMAVYRKHSKGIWSEKGAEKRINSALYVRELLLHFFINQEKTYNALRNAYLNIALGLIRYYHSVNNQMMVIDTRKRILQYYPEWSIEKIEEMEIQSKPNITKQLEHLLLTTLKLGRALVSKLIPVPKIR